MWLTVADPAHAALNRLAVVAFLGIALVLWPIWVPWSLWLVEKSPVRRRALGALIWMGGIVSLVAAILLLRWQPVSVVAGHSIRYDYPGATDPIQSMILLVGYVVPTVASFFVSSSRLVRLIGTSLAASLVVTYFTERDTLTSVWCFFAAVLSGQILVAVAARRAEATLAPGTA